MCRNTQHFMICISHAFFTAGATQTVVREGLRDGLLSIFLPQKNIFTAIVFACWVLLINSWILCSLLLWLVSKMVIIFRTFSQPLVHVAFVSIPVFQTFHRMIFGTLTFPETRWYVVTVRDPQMVRAQKKFGNHCFTGIKNGIPLK